LEDKMKNWQFLVSTKHMLVWFIATLTLGIILAHLRFLLKETPVFDYEILFDSLYIGLIPILFVVTLSEKVN